MKHKMLPALAVFCAALPVMAQHSSTAYIITGNTKGSFNWANVKLVDLGTGEVLQSVYNTTDPVTNVCNARTGKAITIASEKGVEDATRLPFAGLSAACAYDATHKRLYYTPLYLNELRYIDLSKETPQICYFEGEAFSSNADRNNDANHFTRMVMGGDGNGYALSNDGNHFVRFTTGRKAVITDLGALQDDAFNDTFSIHKRSTGWGGDMVADVYGNLYVITAFHSVFKVDPAKRIATFITKIEGLPESFTTNGAVINDDGKLVVGSANVTDGYYEIDMYTWKITGLKGGSNVFNPSDMANGNLAFQKDTKTIPVAGVIAADDKDGRISLYPNPVSTGVFRVNLPGKITGLLAIQVTDITGKLLHQQMVNATGYTQVAEVRMTQRPAQGVYMVKVLNNSKKAVFTDKLVVE